MSHRLFSSNEWDPLEAVIVGTVDNFHPPLEFNGRVSDEFIDKAAQIAWKGYPSWYLDEVAEDLEGLCDRLREFGVSVFRPQWSFDTGSFHGPSWSASGFDLYNVRDLHIIFGNKLVVSAPSARFRVYEAAALQNIFYDHFFDAGMDWVTAPSPKLIGEYIHELPQVETNLQANESIMHQALSGGLTEIYHRLLEKEVLFDAANIIRFDDDVLYLVSSTGNRKGAAWLQQNLKSHQVHLTDAYRSSHLDSTILPLRKGLVLLNAARVNDSNTPTFLHSWDKIFFNTPAPVCANEVSFHKEVRFPTHRALLEMGVNSNLGHISSPWAGLNVLSVNPETVFVHDRQVELISVLRSHKLDVVPIKMRHCYTMLGGLHCVTLDVMRRSV